MLRQRLCFGRMVLVALAEAATIVTRMTHALLCLGPLVPHLSRADPEWVATAAGVERFLPGE